MDAQIMVLVIVGMFVFLGLVGYLLETEEEPPTAPAPEAEHDHH